MIIERTKSKSGPSYVPDNNHHHYDMYIPGGDKIAEVAQDALNAYLEKHGPHFSPALADWASASMTNADGKEHRWTCTQIKSALNGMEIPAGYTIGDITYAANMAYADYYPRVLKDEQACIKYALATAEDPDGYAGMIFWRWLADVKHKTIEIDWEKY